MNYNDKQIIPARQSNLDKNYNRISNCLTKMFSYEELEYLFQNGINNFLQNEVYNKLYSVSFFYLLD